MMIFASSAAGFVVQDVQRVQVWGGSLPAQALQSLFESGLGGTAWDSGGGPTPSAGPPSLTDALEALLASLSEGIDTLRRPIDAIRCE